MWYVIKTKNKSFSPYFNQYLFIYSNDILKDVKDLKYTKSLYSFLKSNNNYQSISGNTIDQLQIFFDVDGVLLPDFEIEQKVKLIDSIHKGIEFVVKEKLSTDHFLLLTKFFNHNVEITASSDYITI